MEDAKKDLFWVIFFLIIIAVVWYFTGGPARPSTKSGLFLFKPQEQYSEELRSTTEKATSGTSLIAESAYRYKIILSAGKEYIEIRASVNNTESYNITGWILESKEKRTKATIGGAANLPLLSQINPQNSISLQPGEKAVIITGESPMGTSFRINKCTGYFSQLQNFVPQLPIECPHPVRDEVLPSSLDNNCLNYINTNFKLCTMYLTLPSYLSSSCRDYINERINYTGCVNWHKNDADFYKPEWRVYLNQRNELWDDGHGTIILRDKNDKIIDWVSY